MISSLAAVNRPVVSDEAPAIGEQWPAVLAPLVSPSRASLHGTGKVETADQRVLTSPRAVMREFMAYGCYLHVFM